jgi:hypothetical protein
MTEPEQRPEPEAEVAHPGERPCVLRRDGEPHRAKLLLRMSLASMACAWLAFLFWVPGMGGVGLGLR